MSVIRFSENPYEEHTRRTWYDFSYAGTQAVRRIHQMVPGYRPTPLATLKGLARKLGVRAVLVKDESGRFGLKAFKGLGGIFAMFRIICRELKLDPAVTTLSMLQESPFREQIRGMTFATTTDGNHGKGVSWAAGLLGCKAYVYMPRGTVPVRAQAIRDAGNAQVTVTDMLYDDCVAMTKELAGSKGWHLIQDTSWDGYEQIPLWIMQGYTTLYYEALDQMQAFGYDHPTHIFLQAGVGSMAGAIAAAAVSTGADEAPVIATVEPDEVACFYESFLGNDGAPHPSTGSCDTVMAGLNCAIPCTLAWDILKRTAAGGFACPDEVTCQGMRRLAYPAAGDETVISGESGAVTTGLLEELMTSSDHMSIREKLGLNEDSVVFLISTEGDTDPEHYRQVVRK